MMDKMKSLVGIQKLAQSDNQFTVVIQRIITAIENEEKTVTFELKRR